MRSRILVLSYSVFLVAYFTFERSESKTARKPKGSTYRGFNSCPSPFCVPTTARKAVTLPQNIYRKLGVTIHWTGLLDWTTGLDYWTHPKRSQVRERVREDFNFGSHYSLDWTHPKRHKMPSLAFFSVGTKLIIFILPTSLLHWAIPFNKDTPHRRVLISSWG